eukprot:scaffold7544_cov107-Isochrysis_galbana.AAC.18
MPRAGQSPTAVPSISPERVLPSGLCPRVAPPGVRGKSPRSAPAEIRGRVPRSKLSLPSSLVCSWTVLGFGRNWARSSSAFRCKKVSVARQRSAPDTPPGNGALGPKSLRRARATARSLSCRSASPQADSSRVLSSAEGAPNGSSAMSSPEPAPPGCARVASGNPETTGFAIRGFDGCLGAKGIARTPSPPSFPPAPAAKAPVRSAAGVRCAVRSVKNVSRFLAFSLAASVGVSASADVPAATPPSVTVNACEVAPALDSASAVALTKSHVPWP